MYFFLVKKKNILDIVLCTFTIKMLLLNGLILQWGGVSLKGLLFIKEQKIIFLRT